MPNKMLILRGISGTYPDESGTDHEYTQGALHELAATEYAKLKDYEGVVLQVSGETGDNSQQTLEALKRIRADESIVALYGFSGGGYNVHHILNHLTKKERERLELVVVLGAPLTDKMKEKMKISPKEWEESFKRGGKWKVVYRENPSIPPDVLPKGAKSSLKIRHMFGPDRLLWEERKSSQPK